MTGILKVLLPALLATMMVGTGWSFTILPPTTLSLSKLQHRSPQHSIRMRLSSSSMGGEDHQVITSTATNGDNVVNGATATGSAAIVDPLDPQAVWQEQLKSEEVQEVRREIIQKYLSMGIDQQKAEQDVDAFLSDREKSLQYLEMRRYAAAQADELGPDFFLQLLGAFLLGLFANVGVKYLSAYKSVYPDGNGPIPFL
mmetsp:Transcript_7450/g.10691  ORF Transcript_7450/g.10691 Transcript_7450/m.10691 type:complete len:199 (-) Transcript_7450:1188-1784(-)